MIQNINYDAKNQNQIVIAMQFKKIKMKMNLKYLNMLLTYLDLKFMVKKVYLLIKFNMLLP